MMFSTAADDPQILQRLRPKRVFFGPKVPEVGETTSLLEGQPTDNNSGAAEVIGV